MFKLMLPRQLRRSLHTTSYRLANERAPTFSTPEPYVDYIAPDPSLPLPPTNLPIEDYASPLEHTYEIFAKIFRYSVFGSIGIITIGVTGLVGVHSWVEYIELQGLSEEDGGWSGNWLGGGTDPALGIVGRSAARGAWISANWGTGSVGSPVSGNTSEATFGVNAGGNRIGFEQNILKELVEVGDGGWQLAEGYLIFGISKGRERNLLEGENWRSMIELEERLASLRELMGGRGKLNEARESWEGIYRIIKLKGDGGEADQRRLLSVTKKLGDISARIAGLVNETGKKLEMENCENWLVGGLLPLLGVEGYTKSVVQAAEAKKSFWGSSKKVSIRSGVQEIANALEYHTIHGTNFSPATSRAILSSLVSLETHLARNRDLIPAKLLQSTALAFTTSLQSQLKPSSEGIDQVYDLYLELRKSIFSAHLAEVSLALKEPRTQSLESLESSLANTQIVLNKLTATPYLKSSLLAKAPEKLLSSAAKKLSLDCCTLGSISARLIGYLYEKDGKAVEFYEKAVGFSKLGKDERGEREVTEIIERLRVNSM